MKNRIAFLLISLFCFASAFTFVSDAREELIQINQTYARMSDLKISARYEIFDDKKDAKPSLTSQGEVQKKDGSIYVKFGSKELVMTSDYMLQITHDDKVIYLGKNISGQTDPMLFPQQADTILKLAKKIEVRSSSVNEKIMTLVYPSVQYDSLQTFYDASSYLIRSMVFYIKSSVKGKNPKMVIHYEHVREKVKNSVFDHTTYLFKDPEGKLVPRAPYQGYEVINAYNK